MTQSADPRAIVIQEFKPKNDGSGLFTTDRVITLYELKTRVEEFLKTIPLPSEDVNADAFTCAEWISTEREYGDDKELLPWGAARYMVSCGNGNCGGNIIHIMMLTQQGNSLYDNAMAAVSIKYFIDSHDVWMIAREISEALYEGR